MDANVNISSKLQAYLSSKTESNDASNGNGRGYKSWFFKPKPDSGIADEPGNGWYNEAKTDPCLPSLVSCQPGPGPGASRSVSCQPVGQPVGQPVRDRAHLRLSRRHVVGSLHVLFFSQY